MTNKYIYKYIDALNSIRSITGIAFETSGEMANAMDEIQDIVDSALWQDQEWAIWICPNHPIDPVGTRIDEEADCSLCVPPGPKMIRIEVVPK